VTGALTSGRLTLTPAADHDLPALLAMRADGPPDPARDARVRALVERNAEQFAAHGFGLWMLHDRSGPVGYFGVRPRESAREPELYYGLVPEARGRGLATEAGRAVLSRLFAASPEITGAWAVTDPDNLASCRVLERLGMRLEFEGEFDGRPSRVYRMKRANPVELG
jgi:RimJ/RimL family protein N-acetyltransferase